MIFGDFGAASVYDYLTDAQQQGVRRVEARALSHFIEDLLSVCDRNDIGSTSHQRLSNMMRLAG